MTEFGENYWPNH